jgi:hypothetical protein
MRTILQALIVTTTLALVLSPRSRSVQPLRSSRRVLYLSLGQLRLRRSWAQLGGPVCRRV